MNHLAVDLGSRQSQFCLRSLEGQIREEGKSPTGELASLFKRIPSSRVILETCSEAFAVADLAIAAGHQVNIVPSSLAPSLGVGQRNVKNDRKDAQNLSIASCRMEQLPQVHLPSIPSRDLRAQLTSRATLVSTRTVNINTVRSWGRTQLMNFGRGSRATFTTRVKATALGRPSGLPIHIERLLDLIDFLNQQIAKADKELLEVVEADPICQKLMTVPGVGPVTAATFRAVIDEVSRFKTAHALESYVGLTPGESSSGMTVNHLGVTRAGSTRLRAAMVQAAWCAWRTRPQDPMVTWAKNLAGRRPKQVAIVALARKMVGILFALWRDGATYDSTHLKTAKQ